MKNFIIAGVCLAAVAGFLTVVWLTNDGEGDSSQAAPEGPTRITNSLRSPQTIEESAVRSEAIARVRVLEQSEQLYGSPPTWEPSTLEALGSPYVWFRAEVLQYLKGADLGKELILLNGGGPDVVVEGRVGARSGLAVGDEAMVFLRCDAPMPVEGDCWVSDAYIIDGDTARSPLNEKEVPTDELEPRIEAALEAAEGTVPLPTELSLLTEGNGGGLDSATAIRVVNAPNPFPDVVATVNGQEISGTALARRIEILRINYEDGADGVPDQDQLVTEALDALIANELLAQAARERGLWPSEDEVVALARRMKEDILQLPPTSPQREAAETLLREQGFDISELDSNPVILQDLARALATGRVTSDLGRPPPGQSLDIDAVRAAIKKLSDSLRSEADIAIYVSATAE